MTSMNYPMPKEPLVLLKPPSSIITEGQTIKVLFSVADPGFPRGGGANPPEEAPIYDFARVSQKLHEIERIWTGGGRIQNFTM